MKPKSKCITGLSENVHFSFLFFYPLTCIFTPIIFSAWGFIATSSNKPILKPKNQISLIDSMNLWFWKFYEQRESTPPHPLTQTRLTIILYEFKSPAFYVFRCGWTRRTPTSSTISWYSVTGSGNDQPPPKGNLEKYLGGQSSVVILYFWNIFKRFLNWTII